MENYINTFENEEELLQDIYKLLNKKILKKYLISNTKGILLGKKWIVKLDNYCNEKEKPSIE